MDKLDAHIHPSTKFPWLILVLAILQGTGAINVNAYQAEGGFSTQTFGIAFLCHFLSGLGWSTCWLLGVPLILPLLAYVFAIFFGYKVMQKSK